MPSVSGRRIYPYGDKTEAFKVKNPSVPPEATVLPTESAFVALLLPLPDIHRRSVAHSALRCFAFFVRITVSATCITATECKAHCRWTTASRTPATRCHYTPNPFAIMS
uniref:MSP domain-containing protein n=1 Tax=Panagrellus redivivus TaxID=6233 RepID=A0A7E4UP88_PANRE